MAQEVNGPSLKCNICGGTQTTLLSKVYDVKLRDDLTVYVLHRCCDCGFVFIDPCQVSPKRDYYGDPYYSFTPFSGKQIEKWKRSVMPEKQSKVVLDVGCGSGAWLYQRKLEGHEVWGLEIDDRAATAGRESGLNIVKTVDELPDGRFDLVHMSHVLEHTAEPTGMMAAIRQKLRPGGEILILVPNVDSVKFLRTRMISGLLDVPRHLVFFSVDSMGLMLENSGYTIERLDCVPVPSFFREFAGDLRRFLVYSSKAKPGFGHIASLLFWAIFIRLYKPSRAGRANDWILAQAHRPAESASAVVRNARTERTGVVRH